MKKLTKLIFTLPITIAMLSTPYQTLLAKENIANNKSNIKTTQSKNIKNTLYKPTYYRPPGVVGGGGGSYGMYKEVRILLSLNIAHARPFLYKQQWYNGKLYKGTLYIKTTEWAGYVNYPFLWVTYAGYLY